MKKNIYCILSILSMFMVRGFAQNVSHSDSVSIRFVPLKRIADSADLVLKVIYRNLKNKPIYVYQKFLEGEKGDHAVNVFIDMQKKNKDGKYLNITLRTYIRDPKFDMEEYRHFDLDKKLLKPFAIDTVSLDLLSVSGGFYEGEYRFKTYLRVKTIPDNKKYNYATLESEPPQDQLIYINSDWIYFKVPRSIFRRLVGPDGKPR